MARPMLLIKKDLLHLLYNLNREGVPVCALIRKQTLPITPPTLTKLLSYMELADQDDTKPAVQKLIYSSLFPIWLDSYEEDIVKQGPDWRYEGKMPIGKWVKNDWNSKTNTHASK